MERLIVTSLLTQAKAGLPDGFNQAALDGMDAMDQIEFLDRFKAAMPKPAAPAAAPASQSKTTTPAAKPGATVPAMPTGVATVEPGSMAERARLARETLQERRQRGEKGLHAGGAYV
jgi:hypothetical protein